jgi:ubiquinone/menaquinone biosynthesis C-methylase UbiE
MSDYMDRNREHWNETAKSYVRSAERNWAAPDPSWGVWNIPETEINALPPDLTGKDAIELGCGTAYFSAWLAKRGANVTGIDLSPEQLATARRMQQQHGIDFPLIEGNAEEVPKPDASFDLVLSEYGASIWCDPYKWIPEAARLLRPGGRLVFLVNSVLLMMCVPPSGAAESDKLARPMFGMHRFEWTDFDNSVEFHLPHGKLIALLRENGFEIDALHELQAPEHHEPGDDEFVAYDWARKWPSEEIWVALKRPR